MKHDGDVMKCDGELSVVPVHDSHMRFALTLRVVWELYVSQDGKDVKFLGHIRGCFGWPFNTRHPYQEYNMPCCFNSGHHPPEDDCSNEGGVEVVS